MHVRPLDMYVGLVGHFGHVYWTCMHSFRDFMCILWTCIDGFDVWIHVEIESDAEMWFVCYIVNIYVVFWFIC
jgi:hypothetical protein